MSRVIVYDRTEKDFTTRGLGIIKNALNCNVEEIKNGAYEAYLELYLYDKKADLLKEENFIYCTTPRGYQPFRIYRAYKNEKENLLQVYACHLYYDNEDNFIEDTNIVNKDGAGAIDQLFSKTVEPHNFKVLSDIPTIANSRIVRMSPLTALMDSNEDNSLINRWGGEIERDHWTIKLLTKYGTDRGVNIKYGKNLQGLIVDTNMKGIATKIMPQGFDGLFLPEKYVESPLINNYEHVKIRKYEFPSIKAQVDGEELKEGELTKEEAYEALRNAVKDLYEKEKVDIPPTTLKVNFIELSKTEQYKDYAVLEKIYPFDTITIKHGPLGINIKVDMNYYKWDSLRDKYISIECGSTISNFVQNTITVEKVKEQMTSALAEAKKQATALINSGLGGYTLKTRDEFLIMDTDNINTAKRLWRWNINGLGYSSTGYNGNFSLAMTMDGAIVADFITVGTLDAALIKTGTLTAVTIKNRDGSFQIDLSGTGGADFYANYKKAMSIASNKIDFYNWGKYGDYIGSMGSVNTVDNSYPSGNPNKPNISLWNDLDSSISLGYKNTIGPNGVYIRLDKYNVQGSSNYPIMFYEQIGMNGYDVNLNNDGAYIGDIVVNSSYQAAKVPSLWADNKIWASSHEITGADYAECFEWTDENSVQEDRVGYLVALDGDKIIKATGTEILGIISGTAGIIGDNANEWDGKYLKDKWGRICYYKDTPIFDVEGYITGYNKGDKILNHDYDENKEYLSRSERKEWGIVGMLGKLICRDDGTSAVGGYIKAEDGIATNSTEKTKYKVIERIDSNTIKVVTIF